MPSKFPLGGIPPYDTPDQEQFDEDYGGSTPFVDLTPNIATFPIALLDKWAYRVRRWKITGSGNMLTVEGPTHGAPVVIDMPAGDGSFSFTALAEAANVNEQDLMVNGLSVDAGIVDIGATAGAGWPAPFVGNVANLGFRLSFKALVRPDYTIAGQTGMSAAGAPVFGLSNHTTGLKVMLDINNGSPTELGGQGMIKSITAAEDVTAYAPCWSPTSIAVTMDGITIPMYYFTGSTISPGSTGSPWFLTWAGATGTITIDPDVGQSDAFWTWGGKYDDKTGDLV